MTLAQKRCRFTRLIAKLINQANAMGYEIAVDQFKRTQEEADANAAAGKGIKNSLHLLGLAGDVILYDSAFNPLPFSKSTYSALGEYWESQSTQDITCCWGGRFSTPDCDHFSVAHEGVK